MPDSRVRNGRTNVISLFVCAIRRLILDISGAFTGLEWEILSGSSEMFHNKFRDNRSTRQVKMEISGIFMGINILYRYFYVVAPDSITFLTRCFNIILNSFIK